MADQSAIVQELFNRIDTLPPDKQAIVTELARRFNVSAPSDPLAATAAKARSADLQRAGSLIDSSDNFTRYPVNPYTGVPTAPPQVINPHTQDGGLFGGADQGAITLKHGAAQIANAHSGRDVAGGAHKVISGAMQSASVPATAVGLVTAPIPTVLGIAGGELASHATKAGLDAAGVPEEYSDLASDVAGLAGGTAAGHFGPKVGGAAWDKLTDIRLPRSGTPEQRAAVDWALQNGAPLDAAAATLNPLVRGAQEVAKSTIGAGTPAERAIEARQQWYADKGRALADQSFPSPQTPETAGAAISKQGTQTIQGANTEANDAYSALRDRENDPVNWAEVVTGSKQETRQMMTGTKRVPVPGVVGLDGSPAFRDEPIVENVTRDVPVKEQMPMPVDMREYKAQFAPVLEGIQRQTRLGQQQYAPAQIALEDIVHGPDYVPASVAEKNLGALKRVSDQGTLTGGVKDEAGGLAASMIPKLQSAIDSTVKQYGGDAALKELQTGRAKTAAKYDAIDLVDQLKAEPVKTTNLLTAPKDGNINLLRQVHDLAPDQTPMLGRAWLDSRLNLATDNGGFRHVDKLYSDWRDLGDETKKIIFKNPALVSDLDKFFQSAQDSAKIENTSKTAPVAHLTEQGLEITNALGHLVVGNPLPAAITGAHLIAGNVLSRLLYNPRFVRAAIRGFSTPAGSAGAAAAASNLVAAAGSAATPVQSPSSGSGATAPNAGGTSAPVQGVLGSAPASTGTGGTAPLRTGSADTVVSVPGEAGPGYKATYKLRELADVQPSHSGQTFLENPKYQLKNDRDYTNALNQGKVINWSSRAMFNPKQVLSDIDDATSGPSVTDAQGNVLGGNGRAMIMQRVYDKNAPGAAAYRALLKEKAPQFGINPADVDGMKQPVLVREIPDSEFSNARTKQNAITDFNKKGTASLTAEEQAIADSRRVSQTTLDDIAAKLDSKGADATLAEALEGKGGVEVLERLVKDGVISPQEQAGLTKEDKLTPGGKDRISKLMTARFFEDPKQLDGLQPSLRNKVERIAAPLAQVETRPEWNLSDEVQTAVNILHEAQALKIKNVDDFLAQDGLFGKAKHSEKAVAIAKAIQGMKPTELAAAFRQYAQDANYASKGANTLLGDAPTPESAFEDAFGKVAAKNSLAPKD